MRSSLFPRTLFFLLITLAAGGLFPSPPAAASELTSAPTFAAAQARAKAENRLLFLLFKSPECKHCRKFSRQVLDTKVFQEFARDHLSLMIYDVDAYAALPESERKLALSLEKKYSVEQMPAIVIFSADGRKLLNTQGYRGTAADKIVGQLRSFLP